LDYLTFAEIVEIRQVWLATGLTGCRVFSRAARSCNEIIMRKILTMCLSVLYFYTKHVLIEKRQKQIDVMT